MPFTPTTQSFVLSDFSNNVIMGVSGELITESIPILTSDATAIFYVSLTDMKNVFKYQSDASDIILTSGEFGSDIKYFVVSSAFPLCNPADASMNDSKSVNAILGVSNAGIALSNAQSTVAADYIRYLALKLFNTAYGEELFSNGYALNTNITSICNTMWVSDISGTALAAADVRNTSLAGVDATTGYYYKTETDKTDANLCRELMAQLAKSDPARFVTTNGLVADTAAIQSVPFVAGDSINYLLKINPAVGQNNLTGVSAFGGRTYQIRMYMV